MRGASKTVRVAARSRWIATAAVGILSLRAGAPLSHLSLIGGASGGPDPSAARAAPPSAHSVAPPAVGIGAIAAPAYAVPVAAMPAGLASPIPDAGEYAPQAALLISARELASCRPGAKSKK